MAASGNSRGHVCLRVGETINRTWFFSKSALGRRSRTGSVALNADRRRLVGVAGLTAFDISPSQSFSNVCSGGWREVGEGVDGNAVWPYTRATQPAAGFDRCVSRSALTPNPTNRFVLAVQVRTAIEGEREGRRESGAKGEKRRESEEEFFFLSVLKHASCNTWSRRLLT